MKWQQLVSPVLTTAFFFRLFFSRLRAPPPKQYVLLARRLFLPTFYSLLAHRAAVVGFLLFVTLCHAVKYHFFLDPFTVPHPFDARMSAVLWCEGQAETIPSPACFDKSKTSSSSFLLPLVCYFGRFVILCLLLFCLFVAPSVPVYFFFKLFRGRSLFFVLWF